MAAKKKAPKAQQVDESSENVAAAEPEETEGTPANDALADIAAKVTRVHDKVFPQTTTATKQSAPVKKDTSSGGWAVLLMGLTILALPILALVALASIGRTSKPVTVHKL